jgi:hypothetical protein
MLPEDPYRLDNSFVTKGWMMVMEGKKGIRVNLDHLADGCQ